MSLPQWRHNGVDSNVRMGKFRLTSRSGRATPDATRPECPAMTHPANDNAPDATGLQAAFATQAAPTLREQVLALTRAYVALRAPRDVAPPTARGRQAPAGPSPLTRARMCA